jgi:hypothetical protein
MIYPLNEGFLQTGGSIGGEGGYVKVKKSLPGRGGTKIFGILRETFKRIIFL